MACGHDHNIAFTGGGASLLTVSLMTASTGGKGVKGKRPKDLEISSTESVDNFGDKSTPWPERQLLVTYCCHLPKIYAV